MAEIQTNPMPAAEAAAEVERIMDQAQAFASAWSLVDGPFDNGSMLESAQASKEELRRLVKALARRAAGQRADIAPGVMRCAKCKFKLIRKSLNVDVGTVTAGNSNTEPCPNGCGPLWPVTWREEAEDNLEVGVQLLERAKAAEDRLARLTTPAAVHERWCQAVAAFESCGSDDDVADGFIDQVKAALARGREKGRGGWQTADVAEIHRGLHKSLAAGQPVDVAAYCMFLWSRGDRTEPAPLLLKGIGKIAGDGWKDTTTIGEVVYAWNREMPEPYKAGQFPRLGNPIHSASTEQYAFRPCSDDEAIAVIDQRIEELRAEGHKLRDALQALPGWLKVDVDRDELVIHGKRYAAAIFGAGGLAGIPGELLQLVDGNVEAVTLKRWTIRNLDKILAEVDRATVKFPTWPNDALHAVAILGEEFGELTKANLQMTYEPHKVTTDDVASESIQTAAMALRFAMSLGRYSYTPSEQHSQGSDA